MIDENFIKGLDNLTFDSLIDEATFEVINDKYDSKINVLYIVVSIVSALFLGVLVAVK